jgi:hypothetical protein
MRSHRTGPVAARHCQRIRAYGAPPPWPISSGFALDSPLEGDGFERPVPRHGSLSCLHISWAEPCEADIILYRSPYNCFPLEKTGCNPS